MKLSKPNSYKMYIMDGKYELKWNSKIPRENVFVSNVPLKTHNGPRLVVMDKFGNKEYRPIPPELDYQKKRSHSSTPHHASRKRRMTSDTDSKSDDEEQHGSKRNTSDQYVLTNTEVPTVKSKAAHTPKVKSGEGKQRLPHRKAENKPKDTKGNSGGDIREERVTKKEHKCSLNNTPAKEMLPELSHIVEPTVDNTVMSYLDKVFLILRPRSKMQKLISYICDVCKLDINYKSFSLGFFLGMLMLTLVCVFYVTFFTSATQFDTNSVKQFSDFKLF